MLVPETDRKCPLSTRRQVTFLSFRNRSRRPSKSKPAVGRHIRNMLRNVCRKNITVRLQFFKPRIIRGLPTDLPRSSPATDRPCGRPLRPTARILPAAHNSACRQAAMIGRRKNSYTRRRRSVGYSKFLNNTRLAATTTSFRSKETLRRILSKTLDYLIICFK